MLFKRGFEYLIQKGINRYKSKERRIEFDKFDSSMKVKQLYLLIREKLQ